MTARTPSAEVSVDVALARALLEAQCPLLARLPLRVVAHGWDNVTCRLGEALAVRLPRRQAAAPLIAHEQRWLASIARRTSLPVPEPVFCGVPGEGYPWRWSVVRWIDGVPAMAEPLAVTEAARFGRFLASVHAPAPPQAPRNPFRGGPLAGRRVALEERLAPLCAARPQLLAAARALFDAALAARPSQRPVWIHGDLHPKNVLVHEGRLAGVIDWGDVSGGDAAADLAALYALFDAPAHDACWRGYGGGNEALRRRARGWALYFAATYGGIADDPAFTALGQVMLRRLLPLDTL